MEYNRTIERKLLTGKDWGISFNQIISRMSFLVKVKYFYLFFLINYSVVQNMYSAMYTVNRESMNDDEGRK